MYLMKLALHDLQYKAIHAVSTQTTRFYVSTKNDFGQYFTLISLELERRRKMWENPRFI